jgi:ATP-dependent helicase/nuclease subunit B
MSDFLEQVVESVLQKNADLANLTFILPNRRAGLYLKRNLKNQLKKATFFPEIMTFDKLVEKITGIQKTASLEILFEFYSIYVENTPPESTDSFELFSHWAKTVLDDFNSIDNYLVSPKEIFNTLHGVNTIYNWDPNTEITHNYLQFIQKLELYYHALYKKLVDNQKAYQGMLFREAVELAQHFVQNTTRKYIFVGFGMLKKAESNLIQELLEAGKAEIYWDIPKQFTALYHNQKTFPIQIKNEWNYFQNHDFQWQFDYKIPADRIEVVGVSKKVGMFKFVGQCLQNETLLEETALVLADQNLLPIALQSLPQEVNHVNITMGIPLKHFPFSSWMQHVFELHIQASDTQKGLYFQNVLKVLQHPIVTSLSPAIEIVIHSIIELNKVYLQIIDIEKALLPLSNVLKNNLLAIFMPIQKSEPIAFLKKINEFINYMKPQYKEVELEVLFHHFQLNQQLQHLLKSQPFVNNLKSLFQLYRQLVQSDPEWAGLNFMGEPLQGLQVMGFLETQTLDFKHLILVSANEGILPKNKKKDSFIPFDVRKIYGLPTYLEEEMTQSYLFYRILQRSEKVTIIYNTDTDTLGGGEKSRYITQLLWENPKIKHKIVEAIVPTDVMHLQTVEKNIPIVEKLKQIFQKGISPSALASYIYNPMDFYRQKILRIPQLEEIEETVAENTLGTIVHGALEDFYKPNIGTFLEVQELEKSFSKINQLVTQNFKKVYVNGSLDEGKNKLILEVAINFVKRFIRQEINDLKEGNAIKIIALEMELTESFQFEELGYPVTFHGFVDRVDTYNGNLRIIDYKTGKVEPYQLKIYKYEENIQNYKYSKVLQVMLYSCMITQHLQYDLSIPMLAGIVSFKNHKSGFMAVYFSDKDTSDVYITKERQIEFLKIVETLLMEIINPDIDFLERLN